MQNLGLFISVCGFILAGLVLFRGVAGKCLKLFPLFYSYIAYSFCGSGVLYVVYAFDRKAYQSLFWFYYLITILVEFCVLVEISDHIFRGLPAIRQLGRALTIGISAVLAVLYILPPIIWAHGRRLALYDFSVRASVTKIVVLATLFLVARHFGWELGKNVGGLMLGFSIYLGMIVVNLAAGMTFAPALYTKILWIMNPLAYALCLSVWAVALWNLAPLPAKRESPQTLAKDSNSVALELNRFNNALSKFLDR